MKPDVHVFAVAYIVQMQVYHFLVLDLVLWKNDSTSPGSGSKGEQITVTSELSLEACPGQRQMANL